MNKNFCLIFLLVIYSTAVFSQTFEIDTSKTPEDILNNYFIAENQSTIKIKNIHYRGIKHSLGIFYYKGAFNTFPKNGIILSTGKVIDALGPSHTIASSENYTDGDDDLAKIYSSKTFDAAILEFDFISFTDSIRFIFQFASEEYPEYVKKGVSDVFGFFVGDSVYKKNIALIKHLGVPLTIDLINSELNSDYYVFNNILEYQKKAQDIRRDVFEENSALVAFDGFTIPIETGIRLEPFKRYHFKIAIADAGDRKFDSWILLKANSFKSVGAESKMKLHDLDIYFDFMNHKDVREYIDQNTFKLLMPVYFEFNSSKINQSAHVLLDYIVEVMEYSNLNLKVFGFADERGSEDYNLKLSHERASQIKEYLTDNSINPNRIESIGLGEIKSDEDQKSRKVEFVFIKN